MQTSERPTEIALQTYRYKPSLMGSPVEVTLGEDALRWRVGARSGTTLYRDISAVRLSFRPMSMLARRFRIDIWSGRLRIPVVSANWESIASMTPQNEAYRSFVQGLHRRIAEAKGTADLRGGLSRPLYVVALTAVSLVGLGLAGLAVRAVAMREIAGLAFLLAFSAFFIWQLWNFLGRNRPRTYLPDQIPADLLP